MAEQVSPSEQCHSKALQHCMESITQIIQFDQVMDKFFAKELISLKEFPVLQHQAKCDNSEAVRNVVLKVMRSPKPVYMQFLSALEEMGEPQYSTLVQDIIDEYKKVCLSAYELSIVNSCNLAEAINSGLKLADSLVGQQTTLRPIVNGIRLKRSVGKGFTEFLIYVSNVFLKAFEEDIIPLKKSRKQSIIDELKDSMVILITIRREFIDTNIEFEQSNSNSSLNAAVSVLLRRAEKIADMIKSLWQPFWSRSSIRRVSALVPIYEGITEVVRGIHNIDCRPFCELLRDIASLRTHLKNMRDNLTTTLHCQVALTLAVGFGGATCLILGAILLATPAAGAGPPLLIAGGALTVSMVIKLGSLYFTVSLGEAIDEGLHDGRAVMNCVDRPIIEASSN